MEQDKIKVDTPVGADLGLNDVDDDDDLIM